MNELEANQKNTKIVLELLKNNALLLHSASYSNVATWKDEDISNAVSLASCCQKLAKEVNENPEHKDIKADLDIKLAQMSAVFRVPFPFKLCIESLCCAVDHLLQALAFNHTMDSNLDEKLLAEIRTSEMVLPGHRMFMWFTDVRKLLLEAFRSFTTLSLALSSNRSSESKRNSCAQDLLEQLCLLLEAGLPYVYFRIRIFELLSRWTRLPRGWPVLVQSMCLDLGKVQQDKRISMRQLLSLMVRWIKIQYGAHELKCGLLEVSPELLADLCGFNSEFCEWYIEVLGQIVDYNNRQLEQMDKDLWNVLVHNPENPMGDSPEVTALTERLFQLILKGGKILVETVHMMIDKHMETENTIWNYIGWSVYGKFKNKTPDVPKANNGKDFSHRGLPTQAKRDHQPE